MHSTDEAHGAHEKRARWKTCPICWDSIYISETRPVRWYAGKEADMIGDSPDVLLRLVRRNYDSTLAMPRDCANVLTRGEPIPWHHAAEVMDYARIMRGSEQYMLEQYEGEIQELRQQEKEDELMFGDETTWTQKAIRAVEESKEKTKGIGNPPSESKKPDKALVVESTAAEPAPEVSSAQGVIEPTSSTSETGGCSTTVATHIPSPPPLTPSRQPSSPGTIRNRTSDLSASISQYRNRGHTPMPSHEPLYFYQALPHFYLAALDSRILRTAFGHWATWPSTILPRIERISSGHIVDDDLRKRNKILAHLPYGCEVSFLECDWADMIPSAVLENFVPEIERRRKRNSEKEARDEKERLRAEQEENKRYAAARHRRPSQPPGEDFSAEDFQPLAAGDTIGSAASVDASSVGTSPLWGAKRRQGSQFASLASPSTSPNIGRTVWGTAAIPPLSPEINAVQAPLREPADDGWLQGWEKDLLEQEDDVLAQVQAMSLDGPKRDYGEGSSRGGAGEKPGAKAKKKGKKITLMSTNARRGA